MKELATTKKKLSQADYKEHVNKERNEIAEWVREVLNNESLARKLGNAKGKLQAAAQVEKELKAIKTASKAHARIEQDKKEESQQLAPVPVVEMSRAKEVEKEATKPKRKIWQFKKKEKESGIPEIGSLPEIPEQEKEDALVLPEESVQSESPKKSFRLFKRKEGKSQKQLAEGMGHIKESQNFKEETPASWPEEAERQEAVEPEPEIATEEKQKTTSREEKVQGGEKPEIERARREIEREEKALYNEEEDLNRKRLDITARRYQLLKRKGELERERFEEFMRKHQASAHLQKLSTAEKFSEKRQPEGLPEFRFTSAYGKDKLFALLEQAKEHIRQNHFEEAEKTLAEAQSGVQTAYMTNNEKKQIEYEILEVEADLKLASLK